MKKLSDFPDDYIMTVEEFKNDVKWGGFIDYDGYGYPVVNDTVLDHIVVLPSKVNEIPAEATHVVWFNR